MLYVKYKKILVSELDDVNAPTNELTLYVKVCHQSKQIYVLLSKACYNGSIDDNNNLYFTKKDQPLKKTIQNKDGQLNAAISDHIWILD